MNDFIQIWAMLYDYLRSLVTSLRVCVEAMWTQTMTALRALFYDVLFLDHCVLSLRGALRSDGQFPDHGITVIVVVALFLIESVIFSRLMKSSSTFEPAV